MSDQLAQSQSELRADADAISAIMDQVPEPPSPTDISEVSTVPPPAPEVPEAKVTPDTIPDKPAPLPDSEEDLEKELDRWQPKTPNEQKAIPALKAQVKQSQGVVRELKKQLEDMAVQQRTVEPLTPEIKQELSELRQLRRAEDPRQDPELVEKYVAPAESKKSQAIAILKAGGLNDRIAQQIENAGGIAEVARSKDKVPSVLGKDLSWSEWVEDVLLPSASGADRRRVESIITDILNLEDGLAEEGKNAATNFQQRQEQKAKIAENGFNQGIDEVARTLGKMAQKWEAKDTATDEERAAVKAHNERLDKVVGMIGEFKSGLSNPSSLGRIAAMAAQSAYLMESNQEMAQQLGKAHAENKALQERLDKVKGSASTARQSNAAIHPEKTNTVAKTATSKQAVDAYLAELDS